MKETFVETGNLTVKQLIKRLRMLPGDQQVFVDGTGIGGLSYGDTFVTIQTEDYHPEEHEADDEEAERQYQPYPCCGVKTFGEHYDNIRAGKCSSMKLREALNDLGR